MKLLLINFIIHSFFVSPDTVHIQPLGNVQSGYIKVIEQSIKSFYGFNCKILPAVKEDISLYTRTKLKYDANKIIKRFYSSNRIIVITQKDISHWKDAKHPEWGILGLGILGSNTCVVSTHRLGIDGKVVESRLRKVVIHEIGHNLGLSHCKSKMNCIMKDVNGIIKTIDSSNPDICSSCRKKVRF
jgi:archaemetzincin